MSDCLFCKIIAGDIPSYKVYEDEKVFAFLDIHPVNPGDTLILPKIHSETFLEMSAEDRGVVMTAAAKISKEVLHVVGAKACNLIYNVGVEAGQVILHTHLHLIPRFSDDGHQLWKEMKEMPDLKALSEQIRAAL